LIVAIRGIRRVYEVDVLGTLSPIRTQTMSAGSDVDFGSDSLGTLRLRGESKIGIGKWGESLHTMMDLLLAERISC
jgi:hypothetical protein